MDRSRFIAIYSPNPHSTLSIARSFSPCVEKHLTGSILFPVSRRYQEQACNRLLQISTQEKPLDFGLASTRTVAILAARLSPGSRVPEKQTSQFIRLFATEQLFSLHPFTAEASEILTRWGIYKIGQLADLPQSQLVARMGREGLQLQRLAQGKDLRPFDPLPEPIRFVAAEDLEWDIEDMGRLTFLFRKLLEKLCCELEHHGLSTDHLDLKLELRGRKYYRKSISLAFPMRNSKVLLSLLRLKIQSARPKAPISRVELEARPSRPQIFQHSLLEPNQTNLEKFSRTISRLCSLAGESNLGVAVALDTHQPDRFRQIRFSVSLDKKSILGNKKDSGVKLVLRRLRPPRPIEIHTHQIVNCSGPWCSSGNWWETERVRESPSHESPGYWSRDEWDIEMVNGVVCRIFWDKSAHRYFMEGIYD